MLDESGLESTLDWYLPVVERQAGIHISYKKSGTVFPVDGDAAIHVYRVLQEALNNVTRHSGAKEAWVRLRFLPQTLELQVEDHGSGFTAPAAQTGNWTGCDAGARRAFGWFTRIWQPAEGGTLIRLTVPEKIWERKWILMADKISVLLVDDHSLVRRGFRRILEDEQDIVVTGEAGDGAEAVRLARELQPQVVVMDCAMPEDERPGSHAKNSRKPTANSGAHAQHASRGNLGAPGSRCRRAWIRSEECR